MMANIEKELFCNKCGKTCQKPDHEVDWQKANYGLNNVTFIAGYYSDRFCDLDKITFSICEECLFDLFLTFTIPVQAQEVQFSNSDLGPKRDLKLNKEENRFE